MGRHGLRVEVDGRPTASRWREDDAVFLFQCARELLWNVVKHGDTDRATIAYGRDGSRVSLAVVDNGKGFDPLTVHADGKRGGAVMDCLASASGWNCGAGMSKSIRLRGGHLGV